MPSALLSFIKQPGVFESMTEVHREAQGKTDYFSYFSSVLKNSQVFTAGPKQARDKTRHLPHLDFNPNFKIKYVKLGK